MFSAAPIWAQVAPSDRAWRTQWVRYCWACWPAAATRGSAARISFRDVCCSHGATRGGPPAGPGAAEPAAAGPDGCARSSAWMISPHSATHSLQMYTPCPATSLATSVFGLRQNEQHAITVLGVSAV